MRDAVNFCNSNATCVGLMYYNKTNPTTNITNVSATFSATYVAARSRSTLEYSTFLRAPNASTLEACFLSVSAATLYASYEAPHEDTAFKDLMAPTVDGIELTVCERARSRAHVLHACVRIRVCAVCWLLGWLVHCLIHSSLAPACLCVFVGWGAAPPTTLLLCAVHPLPAMVARGQTCVRATTS